MRRSARRKRIARLTKIGIENRRARDVNERRARAQDRLVGAISETVGRLDRTVGVQVALEERTADADLDPQVLLEELADILARNLVQQGDRRAVALLDLEARRH